MRKQRELPAVTGNVRTANLPRGLVPGFENSDDDRHLGVRNFQITELNKNNSASVADDDRKLACVSCPVKHVFDGSNPVCLILTDQNFPPSLLSVEGQCCVIIRTEDAYLHELPGLLKEYFGKKSGFLPEGSIAMFGSLSHLSNRVG
jgi:hypothetical protein